MHLISEENMAKKKQEHKLHVAQEIFSQMLIICTERLPPVLMPTFVTEVNQLFMELIKDTGAIQEYLLLAIKKQLLLKSLIQSPYETSQLRLAHPTFSQHCLMVSKY